MYEIQPGPRTDEAQQPDARLGVLAFTDAWLHSGRSRLLIWLQRSLSMITSRYYLLISRWTLYSTRVNLDIGTSKAEKQNEMPRCD